VAAYDAPAGTAVPAANALAAVITAVSPQDIIAGQAVHLEALNSTLAGDTPLTARFQWDFGDTTAGSNFNDLSGWNAAHLYDTPGIYTVTLTITGSAGAVSTSTLQVNVFDVSAMRTIYVADNGNDANDGMSAADPIQSVAKVQQMLGANTRVLFNDGDTFPMSSGLWVRFNNVVFGSYGDGAQPILLWTGASSLNSGENMISNAPGTHDLTVSGLTFDSTYSQSTDRSPPTAIYPRGGDITISDDTFLNIMNAVDLSMGPDGVLVQNCDAPQVTYGGQILPANQPDTTSNDVTGLRAYFVWVQGSDVTILGNTVANSTNEHCIRIGGADRMLIEYNNLTNLDRSSVDAPDYAKTTITAQIGEYAYIAHNDLNGGPANIGPLNDAKSINDPGQQAARFSWAVVEDNTTTQTISVVPGASHVMIRDNVNYMDSGWVYSITGYNASFNRGVVDLTITGNTGVDNGQTGVFVALSGAAQGIVLTNNLYIAPNLIFGYYESAPVYVTNNDLASFSLISGNVWPADTNSQKTGGGENFVGPLGAVANVTPAVWNAMPQVAGDLFEDVNLPADFVDELAKFEFTGVQLFASGGD